MEIAEDRNAIAALVHAYASMIDEGDLDGVAGLFAEATWRSAADSTVLKGVEQVRTVYEKVRLYDGVPRTKHLMNNLDIDVEPGGRRAAARCSFTGLQGVVPGEPVEIVLSGRYIDEFEKVDGRWRFADRLFVVDLLGDLSRHFG